MLGSRLARGGMAEIYLATALGPEGFAKPVVLKRLHPHLAERPELVSMFLDEARLAAQLHHPNIVQIYDLGREGADHFLCMEYLAGEDLASIVGQANALGTPLPWEVVAKIASGAADGLHFAHRFRGLNGDDIEVVHGDVTPSNLVVTYVGEVKVVDFGIARTAGAIEKALPGVIKGKLSYLAPEQLSGGPIDRRADVFALGVVMHELLTGARLFKRETDAATVEALTRGKIPDPRDLRADVPSKLAAAVMKALKRDPAKRFQSAEELRRSLDACLGSAPYLPATAHLSTFLTALFGEEHAHARQALLRDPTGTGTSPLPGVTSARRTPVAPAVPLVPEGNLRSRKGFVRVVGEVPAALMRAGASVVAVPASVAAFALRWTPRRLAVIFALAFLAGVTTRDLRDWFEPHRPVGVEGPLPLPPSAIASPEALHLNEPPGARPLDLLGEQAGGARIVEEPTLIFHRPPRLRKSVAAASPPAPRRSASKSRRSTR